ncbi:glycosyltransferase family 4 protein [Methanolobus sp. WCC5]|uniref:glycosyltransferase family 4 protein n=1 Tax=Methanolobus sp. WCC5 TaxID=3125785 RepID=UPI00324DC7BB
MKVLFIALSENIYLNTGNSVHIRELARELGKKCSVHLLAGPGVRNNSSLKVDNVLVEHIYKESGVCTYIPKFPYRLYYSIKKTLKFKPDVIYERNYNCYIGAITSKICRVPLIVEINGLIDEEIELQGSAKNNSDIKRSFRNWLRKESFKQASCLVTVTDGLKREVGSRYSLPMNKIRVISNGANTELFKPISSFEARKELGIEIETKYICFVGNLAPWQGLDCLVESAPHVLKKVPSVKFIIVGDGICRRPLEERTKELGIDGSFMFIGDVPFREVPFYINAADICVAPFTRLRNEKIGLSALKVYEYLACGKVVVGSNISGVGDLLEKYEMGIVFPPDDHIRLTDSILLLLTNEKLRIEMGETGRSYVCKNNSWEVVADKIIHICEHERKNNTTTEFQ